MESESLDFTGLKIPRDYYIHKEDKKMALMEVNFFSKALMRPVTMNVILPADKVFFGEETEEENKPFKTLYLLHGVMGNYTDWVTGTCIKRWAEEKNLAVVMPSGANMFYMDHPNANSRIPASQALCNFAQLLCY